MIQALAILAAYIVSTVMMRMKFETVSPDTLNDILQALTLVAFLSISWVMLSISGSWPNLLPFAMVQAIAYAVFLLFKYIGGRGLVRSIDGFVTAFGTSIFTSVVLLLAIPKMRGRVVEVLLSVCCGLPLILAVPSLWKTKGDVTTDIMRAAEASSLVYSRATSSMFEEVEFVNDRQTGARCGIYVDKDIQSKTIYVAFAGSDSKVDWVRTNLDVATEPYSSPCENESVHGTPVVHKGFFKAWKSIEELVWNKVSNVMLRLGGSGKVVVCGHSLGGAVATLASMDVFCRVEKKYRDSFSVITFAAPKIGNIHFRDMFARRIPTSIRIVTVYDPVPKTTINDFVHVKGEYMLGGSTLGSPHDIDTYLKLLKNGEGSDIPVAIKEVQAHVP